MSDKELIAAIGALIGPGVIALVQRPLWSPRMRMLVAFAIMLGWTALVFFYLGGEAPPAGDWRAWMRLLFLNIVGVAASYQWMWKQLGLSQWIEARSSPTRTVAQAAAVAQLDAEVARTAAPPRTPGD